jgi:anti-sigma28 factor (negative regulator of flagellin synthesis)
MRIDDGSPAPGKLAAIAKSSAGPSGKTRLNGSSRAQLDTTDLSRLSQVLQSRSRGAQRIGALREAIANGSYTVDSGEVSRSIVRFYLESPER